MWKFPSFIKCSPMAFRWRTTLIETFIVDLDQEKFFFFSLGSSLQRNCLQPFLCPEKDLHRSTQTSGELPRAKIDFSDNNPKKKSVLVFSRKFVSSRTERAPLATASEESDCSFRRWLLWADRPWLVSGLWRRLQGFIGYEDDGVAGRSSRKTHPGPLNRLPIVR